MGHTIDPMHYKKVYLREKWMWENLRKVEGPILTENDMQERDETIRQLQSQIDESNRRIDELRKGGTGPLTRKDIEEIVRQYAASR